MDIFTEIKGILGSFSAIARVCQVTPVAVHHWKKRGKFPRTDYTGETHYSKQVHRAVAGRIPMDRLLPKE